MYYEEKQKPDLAFFDVERKREKNKKALTKLQKANAELENASDRRSRYQNLKKLEKAEAAFLRNCEKRLDKLSLESDIWADEEQKLDNLEKRRAMLCDVLRTTNEQMMEEVVLRSLNEGALQQQHRLHIVNKELRRNVGIVSRLYIDQSSVFEQFREKERENTRMMMVQDNCFKEIRQKLKMCKLVTIKKKVNPADELVNKAIIKNQKLDNKLRSLCQQAVTVPMLKYRYICAADEERRLINLNAELETVVLVLSERLSDHTGWEVAFQEAEKKVKAQQQAMNDRLKKIEELKAKMKLGTTSRFSSFSKEKMARESLSRNLYVFRSKVINLHREYRSFQPDIEAFLDDLQESSVAEIPRSLSIKAGSRNTEQESSTETSTDPGHDISDSEDSSDQKKKPSVPFVIFSPQSKGSSEFKVLKEPPRSRTPAEDSSESDSQPSSKTYFTERLKAGRKPEPAKRSEEPPPAARPGKTPPEPDSWWDYLI